jgi:hypothetical protein
MPYNRGNNAPAVARSAITHSSCEDSPDNIQESERREAFLRTIRAPLPVIAGLYEGARRMIDEPQRPGRAAFIAHAVREIRNRLPDPFNPREKPVSYPKHLKSVRAQWDPVLIALKAAGDTGSAVPVPIGVVRELTALLDKDAEIPGKVKERFLRMCAAVSGEEVHWAGNMRLAQEWNDIQVQDIAHSSDTPEHDASAVAAFRKQESIIFTVFEYAAEREERIIALAAAATRETLAADVLQLVSLHDKDVFFSRLTDPTFFAKLDELGEFTSDHDLHFWPQGDYVRRMATIIPADVEPVLRRLRPTTPGVTRTMLEIALALPDDLFVNVMTRAKWLQVDSSAWFLDPMLAVMRRLAALRAIDPLLARARRLLDVVGEPSKWSSLTGERMSATPKLDGAHFADLVDTIAELLRTADPMRAIDFFRQRLDCVIELEGYAYDHYGFWSSNLLDPDEVPFDVKMQLTRALAKLALQLGETESAEVAAYFDGLGENSTLYRRLADAVVAVHGSPNDAAARISDPDRWTYGAEGRALLERGFGLLSGDVQERLLVALFERQRVRVQQHLSEEGEATSDDVEQLIAHVAAGILGTAVHHAPEPYLSVLAAALAADAAMAAAERTPEPPAIERLGVFEVAAALAPWAPSEVSNLPEPYGLGGSLNHHIQQNGADWLAHPELFAAIPAYFLGWALNGLDNYLRTQPDFKMAGVEVAHAALLRAQTLGNSGHVQDRNSAAHIGQNAGALLVEQTKKANSTEQVDRLLKTAQLLTTLPTNERFGSRSPWRASSDGVGDPAALAIHVIGQLTYVVHSNTLETDRVRAALDGVVVTADHLQRAALGRFFRWAAVIYPADAQRWADAIFYGADGDANRAAWSGYITWSEPHRDTHPLLRAAYRARIDDIAAMGNATREDRDALKAIREQTLWHVWVFCANDVEPLDDDQSLTAHMLATIGDADLDEALRKIATNLVSETGAGRERVFARAMALWDRIVAQVEAKERTSLACRGVAPWIAAPLPSAWRFAKARALSGADVTFRREAWTIVKAAVDLRHENLRGALEMVERLLQPPTGEVLTAVQQFGAELIVDGSAGDADTQHLARRIDGYLVSNHRPTLLRKPLAS